MSTFSRSMIPFLRISRHALSHQRGINPIQQVFAHDRNGIRGLATVFERNKPHVNIGMDLDFRSCIHSSAQADPNRYNWPRRSWQGILNCVLYTASA